MVVLLYAPERMDGKRGAGGQSRSAKWREIGGAVARSMSPDVKFLSQMVKQRSLTSAKSLGLRPQSICDGRTCEFIFIVDQTEERQPACLTPDVACALGDVARRLLPPKCTSWIGGTGRGRHQRRAFLAAPDPMILHTIALVAVVLGVFLIPALFVLQNWWHP